MKTGNPFLPKKEECVRCLGKQAFGVKQNM